MDDCSNWVPKFGGTFKLELIYEIIGYSNFVYFYHVLER